MTVSGARARLRRSWPEATWSGWWGFWAGLGIAELVTGRASSGWDLILLAGWTWGAGAICYLMAMRRRNLPLSDVIRETHAGIGRIEEQLVEIAGPKHRRVRLAVVHDFPRR